MKQIFFTTFFYSFILSAFSQSPDWLWAKNTGGISIGFGLTTDNNGNVYVTGYFQDPTITFGNYTLNNSGNLDFFIAKYDAGGNVLWAKNAISSTDDMGRGVAVDASGNAYVIGYFKSYKFYFGNDTLINSGMPNADIFIAKYDSSGNPLWAKKAGGSSNDIGYSITSDGSNLYITGYFQSSTIGFGNDTLTDNGNGNIFIAKYDANGNPLWAKGAGGNNEDKGQSIIADSSGNIFVTGYVKSSVIYFGNNTLFGAGSSDIFIAKYDLNGNVVWAQCSGGSGVEEGTGLDTDNKGKIYLTGKFASASFNLGVHALTNVGGSDSFIAQYDDIGNVYWVKTAGGNTDAVSRGTIIDGIGNIYISGFFNTPTITFGSYTLTNKGSNDIFIAKYDTTGIVLWAKSVGGSNDDKGYNIAGNSDGEIYLTGYSMSSSIAFGNYTLTNQGFDVFIAKLNSSNGTGIIENQKEIFFDIVPNPTNGKFILELIGEKTTNSVLRIYNITGESIYNSNISSSDIEINISNQPSGIYFVQVQKNEKVYSEKIVVE